MWRCHVKQRRSWSWPKAGPEQRRAVLGADGGKQRKELEVEEKGPKRNFQKFQGPVYKLAITFKIGLK